MMTRSWPLIRPRQPHGGVLSSVAWNGLAQTVPTLVSLATVPFILHRLGTAGYGVWALLNTLLVFAVTLDGGISASAQRFYALYRARGAHEQAARFTVSMAILICLAAVVLSLLGATVAHVILLVVDIPAALQPGAAEILRGLGPLLGLLLLGNLATGYLRAANRFRAAGMAVVGAQLAFILGLVAFARDLTLGRLYVCAIFEFGSLLLLSAFFCRRHLQHLGPRVLTRVELYEFGSYTWRAQVMNVSALAVFQMDLLFVAALLPIRSLGYLAIASQAVSGIRSVPLFPLAPTLTRITEEYGRRGLAAATVLTTRLNRVWTTCCSYYALVAIATIGFGIRDWVGPQYRIAAIAAVVLTVGNGANLLTGVLTVHCRAIGRPGLAARPGLILLFSNLVVSGPSTYFGGLIGTVASTAVVQVLAAGYFYRLIHRNLPGLPLGFEALRPGRLGLVAGGALALEVALWPVHVPSAIALVASAAVAVVCLAAGGLLVVSADDWPLGRQGLRTQSTNPSRASAVPNGMSGPDERSR